MADLVTKAIFPLSLNGVRSGVQSVLSLVPDLFMLTRLIGGSRSYHLRDSHRTAFPRDTKLGIKTPLVLFLLCYDYINVG